MERTIISHDPETGIARVKFVHNNVVVEDDYNLRLVLPNSEYILKTMGVPFTEDLQLKALDHLTTSIEHRINVGQYRLETDLS